VGFAPHSLSPSELAALLDAERAGAPFLAFRDGLGDLRLVRLGDATVAIGRTAANDVVLDWDPEVSRLHAQLERVGGDWVLVDDGLSRNGCTVNGERLRARRRLEDGDVLRLGSTNLTFRSPAPAAPSTVTANAAALARLTAAERRVLIALCRPVLSRGSAPASNPDIGAALCISLPSVKTHVRSLFGKLDVESLPQNQKRAALARRAIESGLVSMRDVGDA
jgi:DNA-binding CsgD family transcriptional regulator